MSLLRHPRVGAIVAVLLATVCDLATSSSIQDAYPACPANWPGHQQYCCRTSDGSAVIFDSYSLNPPPSAANYISEGWRAKRQINYPESKYTPDSPKFVYDTDSVCVLVWEEGEQKMVCAKGPSSTIPNKTNPDVFWSYEDNPRNNNATCLGSLTLITSQDDAQNCVSSSSSSSAGGEGGDDRTQYVVLGPSSPVLILVYLVTVFSALTYPAWGRLKAKMERAQYQSGTGMNNAGKGADLARLSTTSQFGVSDLEKGLISTGTRERQSIETPRATQRPSLTRESYRKTETDLTVEDDPADDVLQFGAEDHIVGSSLYYFVLLSQLYLILVLVVVILDHYRAFGIKFVEPSVELLVFVIVWSVATVFTLTFISLSDGIRQYYRAPCSSATCSWVEVIKPEPEAYALADRTPVTQWVQTWEKMLRTSDRPSGFRDVYPVKESEEGSRYFEFQCLRYVYSPISQRFLPSAIDLAENYGDLGALSQGLSEGEADRRRERAGPNSVDIRMPSILESTCSEFLTFFYLYQMAFYATFFYWDYWQVAGPMTVIILLSGVVNIVSKRAMQADIIEMARMEGETTVKRGGKWKTMAIRDLVPGDIVKVQKEEVLSCDVVILKGSPVMDESMLTGESTPVQKFQLPYKAEPKRTYEPMGGSKKYTLFAGTRVMATDADGEAEAEDDANAKEPLSTGQGQTSSTEEREGVIGLVYTTGVNTARGQLVQNILFPIKMRFKFDDHLKVILVALVVLSILAIAAALAILLSQDTVSNRLSFFLYSVNIIGEMIHPLLTVVVTVGQLRAASRLKEKKISCVNPPRIALAGKIRVFCFDKTGTLTKEGLDVIGCVVVPSKNEEVGETEGSVSEEEPKKGGATDTKQAPAGGYYGASPAFCMGTNITPVNAVPVWLGRALATAQNVGVIEGGKMVGNEVEVKMFTASGWSLTEVSEHLGQKGSERSEQNKENKAKIPAVRNPQTGEVLEIFKRFEFDHKRMTMSVIVRNEEGEAFVFCKGSYEQITEVSNEDSIPDDFLDSGDILARNGSYVLGVAMKKLGRQSVEELLRLSESRDEVESELEPLGMLVFRNELKEDTAEAIATLKKGDIRPVMITGDNALCGCYIARQCGMVDKDPVTKVFLGDSEISKAAPIVWSDAVTGEPVQEQDVKSALALNPDHVEIALTGNAFEKLVMSGGIQPILLKTRIFARMTPDGKVKVVQLLMERGLCVGMCGDGGNDCGALRAAHVGVAFSNAEASVVSPFTSGARSVQSIVQLICEGRCSAVTSFKAVSFILCYGQGIIIKKLLLEYRYNIFAPVWVSIIANALFCPAFSYAVTLARPLEHLTNRRPSFSLIGPNFLASIIGQNIITVFLTQGMVWLLFSASWFCRFDPTNIDGQKWYLLTASYEASMTGLMYLYICVTLSWPLALGSKFRQPVWKNKVLVLLYILSILYLFIVLVLFPTSSFSDVFGFASSTNVIGLPMIPMPVDFCVFLCLVTIAMTVIRVAYEWTFVNGRVADWLRNKFHRELVKIKV